MKPASFKAKARKIFRGAQGLDEAVWKKVTVVPARFVFVLFHGIRQKNLKLRAAALTYITLLSLAPLLAICFSVLKGIGIHNQLKPFLLGFLSPLGEQSHDIARRIVEFVENIQVGILGTVGFSVLIYSVISMMREIEAAFNDIWRVKKTRSLARRITDYLGVLLVGPLLISLSVAMTGVLQHGSSIEKWFGVRIPGGFFENVVPYILFMLAFASLYMFIPNTRVRLVPALVAGFTVGVLWKVLGWLFGIFVAGSASYAAIYSVFAAMMLFMIWIYAGWLVVLVGASMAYYIQNPSNQRMPHQFRRLSLRAREKLALLICSEVGQCFYADEGPLTLSALVSRIKLPALVIEDVVEGLAKAGILVTVGEGSVRYIPGKPYDIISVGEMLKKLRAIDEINSIGFEQVRSSEEIDHILNAADTVTGRELGKVTLKQVSLGSART